MSDNSDRKWVSPFGVQKMSPPKEPAAVKKEAPEPAKFHKNFLSAKTGSEPKAMHEKDNVLTPAQIDAREADYKLRLEKLVKMQADIDSALAKEAELADLAMWDKKRADVFKEIKLKYGIT